MNDITKLKLWEDCEFCDKDGDLCDGGYMSCPFCGGTHMRPIYYTPEEAREKGYEVRDDDPVWYLYGPVEWKLAEVWMVEKVHDTSAVLAITGQGKPDKDWRPE